MADPVDLANVIPSDPLAVEVAASWTFFELVKWVVGSGFSLFFVFGPILAYGPQYNVCQGVRPSPSLYFSTRR
jgi:hypothetical protein